MKIGTVVFQGSKDDQNTYQLALEAYKAFDPNSSLNGKLSVIVLRNFNGDTNRQDRIPSGWFVEQVLNLPSLCIDGGSDWHVFPTAEAWSEISNLINNK